MTSCEEGVDLPRSISEDQLTKTARGASRIRFPFPPRSSSSEKTDRPLQHATIAGAALRDWKGFC
jgi:hypothetical protein